MKLTVKSIIIIFSYLLFCLVGFIIFGVSQPETYIGTILASDVFLYKLLNGIFLFIEFLPSICGTGALIGLSWVFSLKTGKMERFSKIQLNNLKTLLVVGLLSTTLCFVSDELFRPMIEDKQAEMENNTHKYVDFFHYAIEYKKAGDFSLAKIFLENALKIYPDSPQAQELLKEIEYERAISPIEEYNQYEEMAKFVANYNTDKKTPEEEIKSLLDSAREYYKNEEFFNAHYYATQAQYLSKKESLNYQVAKDLAVDAWNNISSTQNKYDKELADVYAEKKRGYVAMLEADYVKSYYIFTNLIAKGVTDSDIVFYKDVSENGLLNSTFFIDETETLRSFEFSRDVYFSINNTDGTKDIVYIRGITILENAGQFVQYFRNFSLYKYDHNGNFLKSVFSPYAKMIAMPASSFGNIIEKKDIKKDGYVPYILLKSIDRYSSEIENVPEYTFAENYADKNEYNYVVLQMPYEDINILRQASKGQDKMSLISLLNFVEKAADYGYPGAVYSCTLAKRLSSPLFLMFCFIFIGLFAWNYRLMPGRKVHFRWIFVFPFINILIFIIYNTLVYFGNIFFFILFGAIGNAAMIVATILELMLVFLFSVFFVSLRGE